MDIGAKIHGRLARIKHKFLPSKSKILRRDITYPQHNAPRTHYAKKYLSGHGLEIGALNEPLNVPLDAHVSFVDIASKAESIAKFTDLNSEHIVEVDYIADGFTLDSIPGEFDFVIANHVLEHSANPIAVLEHWLKKLKTGGILFFALPDLNHTFDLGRQLTSTQHLVDDYHFYKALDSDSEVGNHNLAHYQEWVDISAPAILGKPYNQDEAKFQISELNKIQSEIHFHTFDKASIENFLATLNADLLPELQVLEVIKTEVGEVISICKKTRLR